MFLSRHEQIIALAARHTLPTIYYAREYAVAGGLRAMERTLSTLTDKAACHVFCCNALGRYWH